MPCPRFEPLTAVGNPRHADARLPLFDEYDGVCHAAADQFDVPSELRFRCCNHGYSGQTCRHLPAEERQSAMRYSVRAHTGDVLHVVCVREKNYAPVQWFDVRYCAGSDSMEPMIEDVCLRAQTLTFCRNFLRRFPL